MSVKQ